MQLRRQIPIYDIGSGGAAALADAAPDYFRQLYRDALNKLDAKRTTLLVENGKTLSQALVLGARNLKGVELVLNNEVHPYDLLRYERAIFSKAAIELMRPRNAY